MALIYGLDVIVVPGADQCEVFHCHEVAYVKMRANSASPMFAGRWVQYCAGCAGLMGKMWQAWER